MPKTFIGADKRSTALGKILALTPTEDLDDEARERYIEVFEQERRNAIHAIALWQGRLRVAEHKFQQLRRQA